MWRDDKKYFTIAIDPQGCSVGKTKEKLPRVFTTHQPSVESKVKGQKSKVEYIGPFVDGKALKRALRLLRKAFPYYIGKKHALTLCSWCHIDRCPGPDPDPKQYRKNIRNLVAVLKGKRTTVLKKLQKDMAAASKKQNFEEATILRDQIFALETILSHAPILFSEETPRIEFNYRDIERELREILSTRKSIKRIEAYDISNIQGKQATGSMVVFIDGRPNNQLYRKFKIRTADKPDDFAMMQELIIRRLNHPEWKYPQLMIIDGGKGQLSAALKALQKSLPRRQAGKSNITVAAIAKRNNELFLLDKTRPLLLQNLPQSISNLILHIRDEAHRFAISYHRTLRTIDLTHPR